MKTVYQKPEIKILTVKIHHIMSVSNTPQGIVKSVDVSTEEYDGQGILSRRNSLWDDEEEEDF